MIMIAKTAFTKTTILLYLWILFLIANFCVYTVSSENSGTSITTLPTDAPQARSGKCREGSFFFSDGLQRYFECCKTELKPIECIKECPCFNGGYCDDTTQRCRCPAGRTGEYCRQDCSSGYYGIECVKQCTCGEEASCDAVSGLCACADDKKDCQRCRDGLYGPTCMIPCTCESGQVCDANGQCLKGSGKSSSQSGAVVALGVILGIVLLFIVLGFVTYLYCVMKERRQKHRSDYFGVGNSSEEIPFDIGIGRNSVDLLESPVQAPRNLTGLMRFLNNRQEKYTRQTSGMGNRELPSVPEADTETAFLAADGTEHAKIEPISPSTDSTRSFNALFTPDTHMSDHGDNAPRHSPPPPPVMDQIPTPHIIINHSRQGSRHGTPSSSPGSLLSIHSVGHRSTESETLPLTRPYRSVSSPGAVPTFLTSGKSSNYDQLDRKGRRSFASAPSSAGDSGSEYDKLHVKHQRKSYSKSSLKRKRHSFDKLSIKSRTEESDTESDYSLPKRSQDRLPSIPTGENITIERQKSSSGSSGSLNQQPHVESDTKGSGYVRLSSNPASATSGSPRSRSPTSNTEIEIADPYMITDLKDWRPVSGEQYHGSNPDLASHPAAHDGRVFDAEIPTKPYRNDNKTTNVEYAKPKIKRKGGGGANDGNVLENENQASDSSRLPDHDYFVLNRNDSEASTRDAVDDLHTTENNFNNMVSPRRNRTDDYETPMGELIPPKGNQDNADTELELGINRSSLPEPESEMTANARIRVDDYETPMVGFFNPPERTQATGDIGTEGETERPRDNLRPERNGNARTRVDDYETPMPGLMKPPPAE